MSAVTDFFHGFRGRVAGLPKPVRIVLLVVAALLVYLLPILNPPFITTTDSDFASVLFSLSLIHISEPTRP